MITFKVYITPLYKDDAYADTIDVSDYTRLNGVSNIIEQVEQGDFDIGVFTNDGVKISMINFTEKFSDSNSPTSIFPHKRDLAKVDIYFYNNGIETGQFKGFIDDTFTKEDYDNATIDFTIIAKSGLFDKINVIGGSVGENATITEALTSLLDRPSITNYLTYDIANINPILEVRLDNGSKFDNLSYRKALNDLMLISGSILYIENDVIKVRSRAENDNEPYRFYNAGDDAGRTNIIRLAQYNTGVQRAFNSIKIDTTLANSQALIDEYGLRQKTIAIENYITDSTKREIIANYYLTQFKIPKQEFQIQAKSSVAKDIKLFDKIAVSYKPIFKPTDDTLPIYDVAQYGVAKYPKVLNNLTITDKIGFKVIAKQVDINSQVTTLKLREIGFKAGDSMILDVLVDEFGNYLIDENYNFFLA